MVPAFDAVTGTQLSYNRILAKFCTFHGIEGEVTADHLTDESMAKFVAATAEAHNYNPSALKTTTAALGSKLFSCNLPNIHCNPPYFHVAQVLQRWRTHLKEHPHFTCHASSWSDEAVVSIQELRPDTHQGNAYLW